MPHRLVARRRHAHHVDRYLLSDVPPDVRLPDITAGDEAMRNLQDILRKDLEAAFPLTKNETPPPNSLTAVILTLSAATIPFDGDTPSKDFINAILQTAFIDDLLYALRLSLQPRPGKRQTRYHLTRVLSLLHGYVSTSDLLAARLAENHLCLPLLLTPMHSRTATDIAIPLAEEVLHASPRSSHFELAPLPGVANVIDSLSPFQLGTMCRVLALYIDERDNSITFVPPDASAPAAHGPCHPDWRQIEKPTDLLKTRRNYLDVRGRLARERNQAALLAMPSFLKKLVSIISIPPPCRDDIHVIDDALRAGIQATDSLFNNNIANNNAHNNNNHNHNANNGLPPHVPNDPATPPNPTPNEIAAVAAAAPAAAPTATPGVNANAGPAHVQQTERDDDIRERILLMVFRRLTGGHQEDNRLIRADTWQVLDGSIKEAELEWANTGFVGRATHARRQPPAENHDRLFGPIGMFPGDVVIENAVQEVAAHIAGDGPAPNLLVVPADDVYHNEDVGASDAGAVGEVDANNAAEPPAAAAIALPVDGVVVQEAGGETVGVHGVVLDENHVDTGDNNNQQEGGANNAGANAGEANETGDAAQEQVRGADEAFEEIFQEHLLAITSNVMLTHQVEALFIMNTLLGGKRRADIRARLIEEGIFPALNRFFDALDWTDPTKESRTEDTLKVHLLRLIHYLCDGMEENTLADQPKYLFTDSEREVIDTIEDQTWTEKYVVQPVCVFGPSMGVVDGTSKAELRPLCDRDQPVCEKVEDGTAVQTKVLHFCSIHMKCKICRCEMRRRERDCESVGGVESGGRSSRGETQSAGEPETSINHERGLMMKIVSVLMTTTGRDEVSIGRRYLLSVCVETFQRGASVAEKTFVGRQGLLQHLVEQLCCSKTLTSNMNQFRQTSFDLLGHLIKWNRELFAMMNEVLRGSHRLLTRLLDAVSDRLIDSNVFVRSVALSLERFRAEDELYVRCGKNGERVDVYDFESCVLWEFIDKLRVQIVYDLIASVKVDDVNYENISCVNTTLIMFVVSCKDEKSLEKLMGCVGQYAVERMAEDIRKDESELLGLRGDEVIDNFIDVVDFWINYYRYQGRDVNSLEVSTNICFDRFVYMAGLLQKHLPATSAAVKEGVRNL